MAIAAAIAWQQIHTPGFAYNGEVTSLAPATSIAVAVGNNLSIWVQVSGTVPGDGAPDGTLDVTVTPTTGVTLTDQNADGTGNVSNIGTGTAAVNLSSQAEAGFRINFATAGTFTVSVAFNEADANYTNGSVPDPLTVIVS
jgi:hypothetical protein